VKFSALFIFLCTLVAFTTFKVNGQSITIKGKLLDIEDSSAVIGAMVYLKRFPSVGATTNESGEFELESPNTNELLIIKNIGYGTTEIIAATFLKNHNLYIQSIARTEVLIEGNAYRETLESTQMSTTTITAKEAKRLPALMGEVDLLKAL
jgi:hypothetical protein